MALNVGRRSEAFHKSKISLFVQRSGFYESMNQAIVGGRARYGTNNANSGHFTVNSQWLNRN